MKKFSNHPQCPRGEKLSWARTHDTSHHKQLKLLKIQAYIKSFELTRYEPGSSQFLADPQILIPKPWHIYLTNLNPSIAHSSEKFQQLFYTSIHAQIATLNFQVNGIFFLQLFNTLDLVRRLK